MERDGAGSDPVATATADLAELQATRAALGAKAATPWWYHPALGLLCGGLWAALSAHSPWVILAADAVFAIGLACLVHAYRRITGVWVSGLRPGKTRRAVAGWLVVLCAVLPLTLWLEYGRDLRGAAAAGGLVLAIAMTAIGAWWDRLLRAELNGAP